MSDLSRLCRAVRQLLKQGRIIGAQKIGRFWRIPLKNGMPKIKTAKKGPKATWRKRVRKAPTIIHIDGPTLRRNSRKHETEPVILVRQGSRCPTSCHEVDVKGPCRLVYRPNQPLSSGGATLWIEVEPNTNVTTKLFS
ncbi:MAG: DNA-binding protein [Calothrix sp. MO_192.B10]|nr:DNA-binding protein [Calothrix sp. MO_192.B10]